MSFIELPSKAIESASALTVEKMRICCEILKLSYEQGIKLEETTKNFTTIFNLLKNLTPPEKTTNFIKKHYKMSWFLLSFFLFFFVIFVALFLGQYFQSLGNSLSYF